MAARARGECVTELRVRIEEHLARLLAYVESEESYAAFSRALDRVRKAMLEECDE